MSIASASSLLSSSSSSKLFSALNDDNEEDILGSSSSVGRGMYTEGGVIMPEGGANPCVIKVRRGGISYCVACCVFICILYYYLFL